MTAGEGAIGCPCPTPGWDPQAFGARRDKEVDRRRTDGAMNTALGLALLGGLLALPAGAALHCYTCLFPTIAPLDCLKFVTPCAPTQRCLSSVAMGRRGALELVVYEKSCGEAKLCGARGTRWLLGANFTYSTACCSSDLCNGGAHPAWGALGIALPLALLL